MKRVRFSFEAFLLIIALFSAGLFMITVGVNGGSRGYREKEYAAIGDTGYSVRYCVTTPNGIYEDVTSLGELVLEGNYDTNDWGSYYNGKEFITNEYSMSKFGLSRCRVVRIDLETMKVKPISENSFLIGKCRSGELVILDGFTTLSWITDGNSLYKLYTLSLIGNKEEHTVNYLDPLTLETVYSFKADGEMEKNDFLDLDTSEVKS